MRMRKVIKRILDEVLESPPPNPMTSGPIGAPDSITEELPLSSMMGREEEPEFLAWLNSVDWTRDMLQDAWT